MIKYAIRRQYHKLVKFVIIRPPSLFPTEWRLYYLRIGTKKSIGESEN